MAPPMMGPRILFELEDDEACVDVALALALDEVELILLVLELEPVDDVEGDDERLLEPAETLPELEVEGAEVAEDSEEAVADPEEAEDPEEVWDVEGDEAEDDEESARPLIMLVRSNEDIE